MGLFNFYGDQEHRVFHYTPRYYDEKAEERKRMFGQVDGTAEKEKAEGTYQPGDYIRGSFRDGSRTRSHTNRAQQIIGIIGLLLVFAILFYILKFYTLLK